MYGTLRLVNSREIEYQVDGAIDIPLRWTTYFLERRKSGVCINKGYDKYIKTKLEMIEFIIILLRIYKRNERKGFKEKHKNREEILSS